MRPSENSHAQGKTSHQNRRTMLLHPMEDDNSPFSSFLSFPAPPLPLSSDVTFEQPLASPVHFFHKHLRDDLLLKSVLPFSDLPQCLADIVDENLGKDLPRAKERGGNEYIEPAEGYEWDEVSSLHDMEKHYRDLYSDPSLFTTSTCILHPSVQTWESALVFPSQMTQKQDFSYMSTCLTFTKSLRTPVTDEERKIILDLREYTPFLAVWTMLAPLDNGQNVLTLIEPTTNFPWQGPSVGCARFQAPKKRAPPDSKHMNWQHSIDEIDPALYCGRVLRSSTINQRKASRKPSSISIRRLKAQKGYVPRSADYLQELWFHAVRADATFLILYCGTHQRLGIRHRESQTLFLSEPVNIPSEGFTKLQIGWHMAALLDAKDRLHALKNPEVLDEGGPPKRRRLDAAVGNASKPRAKNPSISAENLVNGLSSSSFLLVRLQLESFDSPLPSFFHRISNPKDLEDAPTLKRSYPLSTAYTLHATERLGVGATGTVFLAHLSMGEVQSDRRLVMKFAFLPEQRKRLANEASIYDHLHARGCKNIVSYFGLFRSVDDDALVLILEAGGNKISRNPRFAHPTDERAIIVPEELRPKFIEALHSIHDAGVAHRDVRSQNFLIDERGHVCVIDFDRSRIGQPQSHLEREASGLEQLLAGSILHVERQGSSASSEIFL
ncbi:hypothetical protein DL96DRAFT_1620889 [Flagelloscypha sp. PMI_526]|nr:hypothetical protein DL96DRAFT_1620889 [Flagelloscypha sp. PMI_526]